MRDVWFATFSCRFTALQIEGFIDWLINWLIKGLIDWLIYWLIYWLIDWMTDESVVNGCGSFVQVTTLRLICVALVFCRCCSCCTLWRSPRVSSLLATSTDSHCIIHRLVFHIINVYRLSLHYTQASLSHHHHHHHHPCHCQSIFCQVFECKILFRCSRGAFMQIGGVE